MNEGAWYGEADQLIRSSVGESIEIRLPANPTTGFSWRPVAERDKVDVEEGEFDLESDGFGASGFQHFRLCPLKPGKTQVRFEYLQPWEQVPPEKTCEFELDVEGR